MNERLKDRIAEEWAMLDPVDPLRGLLSDVIDVLAQQQEPRNFCPRCGKRTADLTVIHTCTPPEGGHQ
jgi:hypothetical protein